jgi:hypothetical protein
MGLTITFNILFEVRILHHFFLNRGNEVFDRMDEEERARMMLKYDAREIFDIIPSEECSELLNAYKCIYKRTSAGFIIGLRAEPDDSNPPKFKPFQSLPEDLAFTFYIKPRDHEFLNYTALPLDGSQGLVYIFQNITGTSPRKFPALTSSAPLYQNGKEYLPGDLLSNNLANPTRLFTAKVKTKKNTAVSTDWLTEKSSEVFPMSYANRNDLKVLSRGMVFYKVKTAGIEPSATVKTASGITVTPLVEILKGDFRTLQVDMRGFPEGYYTMHIQTDDLSYSDDLSFFLIHERVSPFGIIRLSVRSDDSLYNMTDDQGFLRSPVYELRFRNRATHWRYNGKKFDGSSVTASPLPLTRFGFIENVTVNDKDGNPVDDLPNPSVMMIKTEAMVREDEKKFYSDIHIH